MSTRLSLIFTVLAGLLALNPLQVQADDECGTAAVDSSTEWTAHEVTCDDTHDLTYETNSALNTALDALVHYIVPSDATGLKVTLEKGITLSGWPSADGSAYNSGLEVDTGENSALAKGIWVVSNANILSGSSGGINVKSTGSGDIPIKIDVLSGLLEVTGGSGVKVDSKQGDVDINFAGTVTDNVRGINTIFAGVQVYRSGSARGNIAVVLKDDAKIVGLENKRYGVNNGVYIHDEYAPTSSSSSTIKVETEMKASIGSESVPVNQKGIHVWLQYNRATNAKKDVTVTHNGKIYAKGNGIMVEHGGSNVPANNNGGKGTAFVTVGEDGVVKVTGDTVFGISLNTPDTVSEGGMRKQSVAVYGKVFGGKNGGAVYLVGGGTLTIGPNAMLMPDDASGSYKTVKVTTPDPAGSNVVNLVIKLDRSLRDVKNIENTGEKTAFHYRTMADGTYTVLTFNADRKVKIEEIEVSSLPCGIYNNCTGKEILTAEKTADTNGVFSLVFKSEITELTPPAAGQETASVSMRGRVYEALPSVMWDMVGAMDTYIPSMMSGGTVASASGPLQLAQNGTMAAANPGMMSDRRAWGSIEAGDGERRLRKSMSGDLSYDFSYSGFATGVDLPAVNDMMFRVGLHHRQGKADVTDGGRVKVSGTGVGVGMAREYSGGVMVDGWLGVTKFDDIEVKSSEMVNGQSIDVNEKTEGVGYAIGLGASKRMALGNLSLTQRGGLTWTSISVDDYEVSYTSMNKSPARGTVAQPTKDAVSMESSSGVTGRYGVLFEGEIGKTAAACCKLFSSLDLEHDFNTKRSVKIGKENYKSESKPTRLRLGFGGSQFWNGDRSSISGAIYLTSAGSGNNTVSGGVALSVEF